MDKLTIGVYLNEEYKPNIGGGYSYYQRMLEKIDVHNFDDTIEVCFISKNKIDSNLFQKNILQIPYLEIEKKVWSFIYKVLYRLSSFKIVKGFKWNKLILDKVNLLKSKLTNEFLSNNKIDLIYYLTPELYHPFNYPFIATHWDLGHKSMFAFPEVSMKNVFEKREIYHRKTLQKAFAIFVESEQSKKELIHFERINKDRIFNLPLFPGKVVDLKVDDSLQKTILENWKIENNKFYFYPAQFWAHKNHYGLILAFKKVVKIYPDLKLVLSGSDKGNLKYIKDVVSKNNLNDKVIFTGFVADEEIFTFYKNAISLIMPTYLGPTNMPLLEAYYLGCKVLCSDLTGHKEQMKENAIYFNPKDENDISKKMIESINSKNEIIIDEKLIDSGFILNNHFKELYNIRKTFGYEY